MSENEHLIQQHRTFPTKVIYINSLKLEHIVFL